MQFLNRILIATTSIMLASASAFAANFAVTNTNNSGAGSLRQAILNSNANPGVDNVAFDVPGAGPHTIQPLLPLPPITDSVFIDGYSQPGSSQNTNPAEFGSDAVLQIELDGSMLPSGEGLFIAADGSTIRGLVINRFISGGITIRRQFGGEVGNVVEGNFIGTDATGTLALGNSRGVSIFSSNNTVGGRVPEARNVISGNVYGVWIQDDLATGNRIEGNYIGTKADGITALGNSDDGVIITRGGGGIGATNNFVGGDADGAGNTIAFNGRVGVFVQMGSRSNAILSNTIFENGASQPPTSGLGIDLLDPFGVTSNDSGDSDSGPNDLQNFPLLTSATSTSIEGTLNSTASNTFRLEFFSNTTCDPSGNGEGERFLFSTNVTTDGIGNSSIVEAVPVPVPSGQFITATATDTDNNTSEFSNCLKVKSDVIGADIDIKPGSDRNSVNPRSKGKIPVAILTTSIADGDALDFDATQVDATTVTFGVNSASITHSQAHVEDVDGDGDSDLALHFETRETGLSCGDTEATLSGETFGGESITGTDSVRLTGCR